MPEKKKQRKKTNVKVRDLKESKDVKGGGIQFAVPGGSPKTGQIQH